MTFGYSANVDLAPFLQEGVTPGGFLGAIDHMLHGKLELHSHLDLDTASWAEDVAANAVRFAWRRGAPRPAVTLHQLGKDGRCRIHFQVEPEAP